MDFKGVLLTICFIALVTGLFKMLLPNGSFKSQISLLIACFFAVSVFYAITNTDITANINLDAESYPVVDFSEKISDEAMRKVRDATVTEVNNLLSPHNISTKKIYVIVHINGMYSITINEIELVFSKNIKEETVNKAVKIVQEKVGDDIIVKASYS